MPLPALALFLTSSRGAAVAAAVGLLLLFAIGAPRIRLVASALIAGAAAGVLVLLAAEHDLVTDWRVDAPGYDSEAIALLGATIAAVCAVFAVRALADGVIERIRVPRGLRLALAAIAAVVIVAGGVAIDPARRFDELRAPPDPAAFTQERGLVTSHLTSTEGTGRWQFWEAGWSAFRSEPLVGIGAGGYQAWWAQHGSIERFVRDAHSLFVETAAELGLLGLALLLGFLGAAVVGGWRRRSSAGPTVAGGALAVLACGLTGAAIEWTWELPGAFAPVVVAAAVLAGPALGAGPERGRARYAWTAGVVVVGAAAVLVAGVALIGDANLRASRAAVGEGDYVRAAEEARSASAIQPWAAAPYLQLALVREGENLPAALRAVDEARERAPELAHLAGDHAAEDEGRRRGRRAGGAATHQGAQPAPADAWADGGPGRQGQALAPQALLERRQLLAQRGRQAIAEGRVVLMDRGQLGLPLHAARPRAASRGRPAGGRSHAYRARRGGDAADRGVRRPGGIIAAPEHPRQHAAVLAEAGPREAP